MCGSGRDMVDVLTPPRFASVIPSQPYDPVGPLCPVIPSQPYETGDDSVGPTPPVQYTALQEGGGGGGGGGQLPPTNAAVAAVLSPAAPAGGGGGGCRPCCQVTSVSQAEYSEVPGHLTRNMPLDALNGWIVKINTFMASRPADCDYEGTLLESELKETVKVTSTLTLALVKLKRLAVVREGEVLPKRYILH